VPAALVQRQGTHVLTLLASTFADEPQPQQPSVLLTGSLDNMSDGFFMLDRDLRFTFLNRQAELLLDRRRP
jgi:PAS domain-containing protein